MEHSCHIFIICYNEEILMSHMVKHYKRYLPNCRITIYDNESTDESVSIAQSLGCEIKTFTTNNEMNETSQINVKNNCWKGDTTSWVIVADMDEWLCVTEDELKFEESQGVSILTTNGIQMVGESKTLDLCDINLHEINRGLYFPLESKKLCFRPEKINEIYYGGGAHHCNPVGEIKYSSDSYINKHMSELGKLYMIKKSLNRHSRTKTMRAGGEGIHYTDNSNIVLDTYSEDFKNSVIMDMSGREGGRK
jgi:ribosome-associated toxin RatA of RatAB toxin-antitoxin module